MASYDFAFYAPTRLRARARHWLRFLQAVAAPRNLEMNFETAAAPLGRVRCYVYVRGSLAAMQNLERELVNQLLPYSRAIRDPQTVLRDVIIPSLRANRQGVKRITGLLYLLADQIEDSRLPKPVISPMSAGPTVREIALQRRPKTAGQRCAKAITRTIDQWLSHRLPIKDAVILCDQAMEEFLKAEVRLPPLSSKGFNQVADDAATAGFVTRREAYWLRRFHRTRNRLQHRGRRVRSETAVSMFEFFLALLNRKFRRGSRPNPSPHSDARGHAARASGLRR